MSRLNLSTVLWLLKAKRILWRYDDPHNIASCFLSSRSGLIGMDCVE